MSDDQPINSHETSPEETTIAMEKMNALETEIVHLRAQVENQKKQLEEMQLNLPDTNLLSKNYLSRAFAVWGHYFVANLIISLPFICIMLAVFLFIFMASIIYSY